MAFDDAEMDAAFGGLGGGFGDFGFGVRTFVEKDPGAGTQGGGEESDRSRERRDGTRGDNGGAMGLEPVLGAVGADFDVGEAEVRGGGFDEPRLLLGRFKQGKAGFREDEGKRNAGESGAAAGIDDVRGAGEEPPGNHRIGHMFDGGFAGTDDAREIEVLVGFDDQIEVAGRARDDGIAMRQVGRKDLLELFGKGHGAFMIALGRYLLEDGCHRTILMPRAEHE